MYVKAKGRHSEHSQYDQLLHVQHWVTLTFAERFR